VKALRSPFLDSRGCVRMLASRMTFSAVLLAGGESRRMGRDKATIHFRGRPLYQWALQILRDLNPAKIFVSARTEPSWLPFETELILDEPPSRGPLSGLTIALTRMQTSHLIVLAVDMPFMTSEQMHFLCSLSTTSCGVVPVIGERVEPLAAIYPREAGSDLLAALAGGSFSLQKLSRGLVQKSKLRVFQVSPAGEEFYRSLNEPGDFKEERFADRPPQDMGRL
jgi:molybdenum cofactor guanylyltransferase